MPASRPATPCPVTPRQSWLLHDTQATRRIESAALASHAPHVLMQRAGLSVARLAQALAPHARHIWVAAGPGNNGGDGLEAAMHLRQWGRQVSVTWLGQDASASADTAASRRRAQDAGASFLDAPPAEADFCVDALLGIGAARAPAGRMAEWIAHQRNQCLPTLAVDVPTGLDSDTGRAAPSTVLARATLTLLTLKPGLFTGYGRDACGQIWLDDLGVYRADDGTATPPSNDACALLAGAPAGTHRPHNSHKGSWGDVVVIGGDVGMVGAAVLAAIAALHTGAGRVYLVPLDPGAPSVAASHPALMQRPLDGVDMAGRTVVCGCGGGEAVRSVLSHVLATSSKLVLDADGLNTVAHIPALRDALIARAHKGLPTVLTPHPLEAARLLGRDATSVQADRLHAAMELARVFDCTVVLKGSGTIVAAPGELPSINPTGNARLATAGTGDVLAGMIGSALAQGLGPSAAARAAVFQHGLAADRWPAADAFSAELLAARMPALMQTAS